MKIVRSFSAPLAETMVRERAATFLTQAGYRRQSDSGGDLHFKRGSNIGVFSSFNPQKWACDLRVYIKPKVASSEISVEAEISTDPTEKRFAEELITAEFSLLEAAVTLNEFKSYDVSTLKNKISSHVYRTVGMFASFIFSLVIGVVGGSFAYVNFGISVPGAAAIGVGILMLMVTIFLLLWKKQKKTML